MEITSSFHSNRLLENIHQVGVLNIQYLENMNIISLVLMKYLIEVRLYYILGFGCGDFLAVVAARMDFGCFCCGAVIFKMNQNVFFWTKYHFLSQIKFYMLFTKPTIK